MHARPVLVVTLLVALLVPATASAAGVRWGPRAGVNASAFSGEFGDLVRPDVRFFPNVGLALQVDLAPNLAIRTEAAYSVKGGGSSSERTDAYGNPMGESKDTWRFDYVEVPLLIRTRVPLGTRAAPYLEIGPSLAVALGGRFMTEGFPDLDLRDLMQDVDMGYGGGFGIEFPAGRTRASLEVRYVRGFSDLMRGNGPTIINQAWTFATCVLY
jgi:hypothetical protein